MIRAVHVGVVARVALERSAGAAEPIASHGPLYVRAAGEIVWLGGPGSVLHPRAVVASGELPARPEPVLVDLTWARCWDPPLPAPGDTARYVAVCADVISALALERSAQGFARLLSSGSAPGVGLDEALLTRALPAVEALAAACEADDAAAAIAPASQLLGLGPGLTPAGDDLVGGVLFARAVLGRAGAADAEAWTASGAAIVAAAGARTHPVSAALLADLASGRGHAPLLDLVAALADGRRDAALHAARRLTTIGHTSGWDILAGLAAGTLGHRAAS